MRRSLEELCHFILVTLPSMEEQAYVQERKHRLKILRQPLLRKQAEWSCLLSKYKGFMRIVSKRDNRNGKV